jgi:O-Antigen ligase
MNNSAILKALIIYAICIPLALVVGYVAVSLANTPSYSNITVIGALALILSAPILLRWHHPLLVLSWNMPLVVFFLPGNPPVYLPMLMLSLGLSVLQRAMNKDMHFIRAPQITLPLLCLALVVLVTAKLTGGIGLHALGNPVMGGKKYVFVWAGIMAYFALTARRVPTRQAGLYVALFLLGGCISVMGDLVAFIPRSFYFIFLIFPPDLYAYTGSASTMRYGGVGGMSVAIFTYMLARYGVSGIFRAGKPWRVAALMFFGALILYGGFRSMLLSCALLFLILFFMEGLHRTRLLPILAFIIIVAGVICIPLASRLPDTFQRALSFLPLNINPAVRANAQASLDWRIEMWKALLPQVPSHLLLGKGYAISPEDYQMMGTDSALRSIDPGEQALALAGDYHNGPLSVILPFGIWGTIAFTWFLIAGVWALNRNRLYGDPALQNYNKFLFAAFVAKLIGFVFVFGGLAGDMAPFAGFLGLSICLNGGICRSAWRPAETTVEPPAHSPVRPRLLPAFQR